MQAASDIFLGWDRVTGPDGVVRDFYVRQLRDWKGSADVEAMDPQAMAVYGGAVRLDARAGPRPLRRPHRDRVLPRQRATPSTRRSPTFAEAYADQNERDYEALQAAAAGGRIQVESGL